MRNTILILILCAHCSIRAQAVAGILAGNATVCSGSNNGTLSLGSYSGNISRWETAPGPNGPWTAMVFGQAVYNYIDLVQTTCFRAVVQVPGYPEATSNVAVVSCQSPALGGIIQGATVACVNSALTLSLAGFSGSVQAWEYSTNNWISTFTLGGINTSTVMVPSLQLNTLFRARVQSGVCPAVYSSTQNVLVASPPVGGTLSGGGNVCAPVNAGSIVLSGHSGNVLAWESALGPAGPFNTIAGSANTVSQGFVNLSQNTYYRALLGNANCSAVYSGTAQVTVAPPGNGGYISGSGSVCAGQSAVLQLNAFTGSINQWESSSNNGFSWSVISNNSNTLGIASLSGSRLYRCLVQSGNCSPLYSAIFGITVFPLPVPAFSVNSACAGSAFSFSNTTPGLNYYQWDFADGSGSNVSAPVHTYGGAGTYTVKLLATSQAGCQDSLKQPLTVYPRPQAGFVSADTACFGSQVNFTSNSNIVAGSIVQSVYDFGDGTAPVLQANAAHYYSMAGSFTVQLRVTSNNGCSDSLRKVLEIYPKPQAGFSCSNVCRGLPAQFVNASSIAWGNLQHSWNFGDGMGSSLQAPQYIYPQAGSYTVSLISSSNHNCRDTVFGQVVVNESPVPVIVQNAVCQGSPMSFSATLTPNLQGLQLSYDFGDGSFSNLLNPQHLYAGAGNFLVKLSVLTDSGCSSQAQKYVSVFAKPACGFQAAAVCLGDSSGFVNSAMEPGLSFSWDFNGKGNSSAAQPVFLFDEAAVHSVKLVCRNQQSCRDSVTRQVVVNARPQAAFSYTNACDGVPVMFRNESLAGEGGFKTIAWDPGDHSLAEGSEISKIYLNAGEYQVRLVVVNSAGCSDSVSKPVSVYSRPVANFSAAAVCAGEASRFDNLSRTANGYIVSFWHFGDGESSGEELPQHFFKSAGVYASRLIVRSEKGCTDSVTRYTEVRPLPPVFAGRDSTLERGFSLSLKAVGALSYTWFPDLGLNTPIGAEVVASPMQDQAYIVRGTDAAGCVSEDSVLLRVNTDHVVIPYNIVTPEGNGMNDTWIVKNIEAYPENEVMIFDQWNQLVLQQRGYRNDWRGRNANNEQLPDGTYYYVLRLGEARIYKGYITLLRNRP